jgi:hypothetical protein
MGVLYHYAANQDGALGQPERWKDAESPLARVLRAHGIDFPV